MAQRAEQHIAAFPDRKLVEQTPADVEQYLADLGKKTELKDWQFRQAVDAIRILFELAGSNGLDRSTGNSGGHRLGCWSGTIRRWPEIMRWSQ